MCLICVEFEKGKLTVTEGFRNLREMENSIPKEHFEEVTNNLYKTMEEIEWNKLPEGLLGIVDDDSCAPYEYTILWDELWKNFEFDREGEVWDNIEDDLT